MCNSLVCIGICAWAKAREKHAVSLVGYLSFALMERINVKISHF